MMRKIVCLALIFTVLITSLCTTFASSGSIQIPAVSKDSAIKYAREYITNTYPDIVSELDFENEFTISYTKAAPFGYNISFTRVIGGIPYAQNYLSMFVDANSGEILNVTLNFDNDIIVDTEKKLISIDEAQNIFKSSLGLNLTYNKKIESEKIVTYLTYSPTNDFVINAQTGNIIVLPDELQSDGYFDVTYMAESASNYLGIDENAISVREADNFARSVLEFKITDDYTLSTADYLKDMANTCLIAMTYESPSDTKKVTIDAINVIPVEYSSTATPKGTKSTPRDDDIENFKERFYKEFTSSATLNKYIDGEHTVYLWERNVNGIPYSGNGLYISYYNTGELKSLSFAWDKIDFEPTIGIIDEDLAYKLFFITCGLDIEYYKRPNNELIPIYKVSSKGTGILNANTGRQLNYDGTPFLLTKSRGYPDIDTHYAGYAASALADCDIYASSGSVNLGDNITQRDFLLLMSELISGTKPVLSTTGVLSNDQCEMLYKYMYANGVLTERETGYNSYVTRADATKYMLRILGYKTIGDMNEIFISHFADSSRIPADAAGYVELARSLGIVHGDTYGFFNPRKHITNGECLIMLYNSLRNDIN